MKLVETPELPIPNDEGKNKLTSKKVNDENHARKSITLCDTDSYACVMDMDSMMVPYLNITLHCNLQHYLLGVIKVNVVFTY